MTNAMKSLVFATMLAIAPSLSAHEGGSDRGGGNICFAGGGVQLLDLEGQSTSGKKGIRLDVTRLMKVAGVDLLENLRASPAGREVVELLEFQRATSPRTVELMIRAFGAIEFYGMPYSPSGPIKADFTDSAACHAANTKAAIIYENGEALISVPLFGELDLESQAALLLHETLRRVQLTYGGGGSDRELQSITRAIVRREPLGLDRSNFFRRLVGIDPTVETKIKGMCSSIRSKDLSPALALRVQDFCARNHGSLKDVQTELAQIMNEGDAEMGRATTTSQIHAIGAMMSEVNHVITIVGGELFRRATVDISTDKMQALRSAPVAGTVEELRKFVDGTARPSNETSRRLRDEMERLRRSIEARAATL